MLNLKKPIYTASDKIPPMRTVLGYMGLLLEVFSGFLVLPLLVAFLYGEPANPFFFAIIISLFVGIFLEKVFKREELTLERGLAITALSFVVFSILGSLPYIYYSGASLPSLLNALFESLSGFTTTGLTTIASVEGLSKSLLFWRSLTQWMGGAGIIIIFLSLLRGLRTTSMFLYRAQGFAEKLDATVAGTTKRMLNIYSAYTLLGIILLLASGLPLFDSVATTLTAISTGGFTVVNTFYTGSLTLAVVCLLMVLGSINFMLHDRLFRRRFRAFVRNVEVRSFFVMVALLIAVSFYATGSLKVSIFEFVSALTATGFSITPVAALAPLVIVLIIMAMIVGSSSGSTSGGMKQLRLVLSLKSVLWAVRRISAPRSAVVPFKVGGEPVELETARLTGIFVFAYLAILALGSLPLIAAGYTPLDSVFQTASAQGTVGLSVIDLSAAPWFVKLDLMAVMLLGRLEIFPILILVKTVLEDVAR